MKRKLIALPIGVLAISYILSCHSQHHSTDERTIDFANSSGITRGEIDNADIRNIALTCKVWGFLKYYHPDVRAGKYNWDNELFLILNQTLHARSRNQCDSMLAAWIDKIGNFRRSIRNEKTGRVKLQPDLNWLHDTTIMHAALSENLVAVSKAHRGMRSHYFSLSSRNASYIMNENPYSEMICPDGGYRLLALFRYWNIIQYYYPYRHLITEDWNKTLEKYIPIFSSAETPLDYRLAVVSLVCQIHDSHAGVASDSILLEYRGRNIAPIKIDFVESKPVIVNMAQTRHHSSPGAIACEIKQGDVIESINHKDVDSIFQERHPYASGSNTDIVFREIARGLLRTNDTTIVITCSRGDSLITSEIKCVPVDSFSVWKIDYPQYYVASPGIGYINGSLISPEKIDSVMPEIMNTKGLVIDMRGYPSSRFLMELGRHLQPQTVAFAKYTMCNLRQPGKVSFLPWMAHVGKKKNPDVYKGKTIILVNQYTQSAAEFHTMGFQSIPGAVVIGSTTAGADGNITFFVLPGGLRTGITGIGVYYPDGRETQRVGIIPDITIRPTIQGIRDRRDEVLERAVEYVNSGK